MENAIRAAIERQARKLIERHRRSKFSSKKYERRFRLRTGIAAIPAEIREPGIWKTIRLAFEHLRVRAGMDDFRFHDLRHEGVSRLFEKGFNIAEVSTISGHKELRMLQRYTHLRAEDLVNRLG